MKISLLTYCVFAVCLAALPLAAQENEETDTTQPAEEFERYEFEFTIIDDILNQTIFAPFRREGTVKESSRPAYVIDRQQIEAQGFRTVNEALRYLPGIFNDGTAGVQLGAESGQIIRGGNKSSQTLILLDGRPINQLGFFGRFDLSNITVDSVERIELIPGGGSTLYGSNAIGGVINIVTRQPELNQGTAADLGVSIGSFGYNQQRVAVSHGAEKVAVRLAYDRTAADNDFDFDLVSTDLSGVRDNADVNINNLNFQVLGELGDRHKLRFNSLYLTKDLGVPGGVPVAGTFNSLSPNAQQYTEDLLLSLELQSRLGNSDDSQLTTRIFADFNNYYFENPDGFFPVEDDVTSRSLGTQIQHNWQLDDTQSIAYGFDYRHVSTNNVTSGIENYDEDINQGALFARYEVDLTPELTANFGLRQDFNSLAGGSFTSPSAGILWQAGETTTIRANYARNFRVPTGIDLFFPGFSNPDLTPEIGNSFDVGIDQRFGDRALLRLTYFNNTINDAINFDLTTFEPSNIGKVRGQGLEAELNVQLAKNIYGFVNYTLNDSEILDDPNPAIEGNELPFAGTDVFNIGVAYENPEGVYVGLFLKNVGDRLTNSSNTQSLPSYTNIDLRARYPISDNLNATASWENIFDTDYEVFPGFPGLGSRFQIGLNASFR